MEDRRERDPREEDRRWPVRHKFMSFGHKSQNEHDREVDRLYAVFGWQQRQLGNKVEVYRDEIIGRRILQRDLHWTRVRRRGETGNPRYKLNDSELRQIADRNNLQFVDGRILIPDRQVLVKSPDGKQEIVSLEAVTLKYSNKQIQRHVKAGFVTSTVHSKPAWKICAERMGFKRVKDGPDMIGRLMNMCK